ncbi:MAG: hypothetical protein KA010_02865 [Saprospiraceae bacterium]|nr:hypothetical protein [Saprospiraceae bacterium]
MLKTFTTNDLIRFVYNETSAIESKYIKVALQENARCRELYNQILKSKQSLPKAYFSPSNKAIKNILNYSKQTSLGATV